ncbi:MAG: serine protease [Deltaproteobacteria bacterium]|nr:serine protease [Deltaproteobacteria bacterium]
MASQRTARAVVRVSVAGATGTGFVVSKNERLILTARHCITGAAGGVLATASLYFYDPSSGVEAVDIRSATSTATVVAVGATQADDWALLKSDDALPAWCTELTPLAAPVAAGATWSTFGFLDNGNRGWPLDGYIRFGGAVPLIHDGTVQGQAIWGVSGGPLVIEEHVVGIIIRADRTSHGVATSGQLYVLPLQRCAPALAAQVRIEPDPPFLGHTASQVEKGDGLPDVARKVWKFAADDPLHGVAVLARLIARWLLPRHVHGAFQVTQWANLPEPQAREVTRYAACQWFPREAVRELNDRLVGPGSRLISISIDLELLAQFVRRAGFERSASIAWHEGCLGITWIPGQPIADLTRELANEIFAKLGTMPSNPDDIVASAAASLVAWSKVDIEERFPECLWAVLPDDAGAEALIAVSDAFPELAVFVRTACPPATPLQAAIDGIAKNHASDFTWAEMQLAKRFPRSRS